MCLAEGFEQVQTYIASGNVVFSTDGSEAEVKAALERRLEAYAGKPVGVLVRTGEEMAEVLKANPFTDTPRNLTMTIFLDEPPPADASRRCGVKRARRSAWASARSTWPTTPAWPGRS